MATKKTYTDMGDENMNLLDKINQLNAKVAKNNEIRHNMEQQRLAEIKDEFFKEKSSIKINITNAFELNVITALAKLKPVEFVKKYLRQYKPKTEIRESFSNIVFNVMTGHAKKKKVFTSKNVYNEPFNEFASAAPSIRITAKRLDGGPYDHDSYEAFITLYFNYQYNKLDYDNDTTAAMIYKLLHEYNCRKH